MGVHSTQGKLSAWSFPRKVWIFIDSKVTSILSTPRKFLIHNFSLEFDVTLYGYTTQQYQMARFQNNIQSLFQRVRLLYGATPLEDMVMLGIIIPDQLQSDC